MGKKPTPRNGTRATKPTTPMEVKKLKDTKKFIKNFLKIKDPQKIMSPPNQKEKALIVEEPLSYSRVKSTAKVIIPHVITKLTKIANTKKISVVKKPTAPKKKK